MTTSKDLLDLVVAALLGAGATADPPVYATSAGALVFRPGDWPTQDGQYPILKLRVPRETKQSWGRSGGANFTTTTTIRITGEVSALADMRDAGASAVELALWQLAREVEIAVIGSYPLELQIQQFATVDTQLSYNSDGETHLAGIQIDLALEYVQGAEDFAPIATVELQGADASFSTLPPAGLSVDLPQ